MLQKLKLYTPIIALFSVALLLSLATQSTFAAFMGYSLVLLATLKLMDLSAFAKNFLKYDKISQAVPPYSYVYPFLELFVGLMFLSKGLPLVSSIIAILIGLSGAISIFQSVYINKKILNCACTGGNSKVPLGIVSITENLMMVFMGSLLLYAHSVS